MKHFVVMGLAALSLMSACSSGPLYKPGSAHTVEIRVEGRADGNGGFITVESAEGKTAPVKLYYFARGEGTPVLMIHGGPGYPFRTGWGALESLEDRYRFVYYHQRGSGKSTRPVDTFTSKNYYANMQALEAALGIGTQLRDIEAFRLALGAEKLILIGHSFGGFLASLYAAEYPERVASLVLTAPAEVMRMPMKHSSGLYGSVGDALPADMKRDYEGFLKRFFDYGRIFGKSERDLRELNHEFIRYYAAAYRGGTGIPEESMYTADEIAGWGQQALFFSMGQKHDYTTALGGITARTLILTGSDDLASEAEILDTYGKIPGSIHVRLDAGHFSFEEAGEAFGAEVEKFLDAGS